MKSLHFKTSDHNYSNYNDCDLSNVPVMKNWKFVGNSNYNKITIILIKIK